MAESRLFTSESVTEGHPDKVCDQISDAILDALLAQDPTSRVAVETMVTTGSVHVAGEVTTDAYVEIPQIVRDVVRRIGYTSSVIGFDADSCGISVSIGQQSPDIAQGVDKSLEERDDQGDHDPLDAQGAGDQGSMFGYASDDTPSLMPSPVWLAHRLAERSAAVRRDGTVPGSRPDGKTQVTVGYDGDRAVSLDTVVLSTQHDPDVRQDESHRQVAAQVVAPVLDAAGLDLDVRATRSFVNPTGTFVVGGPQGDAGSTGRKIIVDTYGGMARHGGGAFSGKDPSKVDRSAAYATRWVAKNVVAAGSARRCEVQVAYAIGKAHPVGSYVETFGTEKVPVERITAAIREVFDSRPAAIIRDSDSSRPIYAPTAAYGHFGRELEQFTWERTDRVADSQSQRGRERAGRDGGAWFDGVVSEREDTSRAVQDTSLTVAPAAPRRGPAPPASHQIAAHSPVARLALDLAPPHSDRPFDYLVPATMSDDARPGVRVKVRFAGRDVDGYVSERLDRSDHDGRSSPSRRVVSAEPVSAPAVARLARAVADHYAGTLSDVSRLAVPPRHARAEQSFAARTAPGAVPAPGTAPAGDAPVATSAGAVAAEAAPAGPPVDEPVPAPAEPVPGSVPAAARAPHQESVWAPYRAGAAFLAHVAGGGSPRAVWTALPGLAPPAPEAVPEVVPEGRR
ncbi:hypothetical protein OY671_006938, partial [Metschnikowia pulcherrima]